VERVPEPELMDLRDEAEAYVAADFGEVNAAFVERLLEVCGEQESAVAVDLGTGPADIPIRVVSARPRWRIAAVDAAAAMLDLARVAVDAASCSSAIDLVRADAVLTGLPTAGYDVVFSNSILHHAADVPALWAEVRRLARPGGVGFFRDLFRSESREQARALVEQHAGAESELLKEEFFRSLLAAYTLDEIRAQLHQAGLAQLEIAAVSDRHVDIYGWV